MNAFLHLLKPAGKIRLYLAALPVIMLSVLSCHKPHTEAPPLPVWEDNSADSARLNIQVQTPQGMILYGQYVNLALSQDSMNNKLLIRRVPTNTGGNAIFRKLYPKRIFYNCYAVNDVRTFYGSGYVYLKPGMVKDTILTVY